MQHPADYTIQQFQPDEVLIYKALRLEALKKEPGMFGNSYELEITFPDQQWTHRITNPDGACFGLFCKRELIGITSIIITDKENAEEAYLTQSYIRKAHRGKGLSGMLYEARLSWANQKQLKRLIIGHRESNTASKSANQHYGFTYTHRKTRLWPDGQQEDMLYYVLNL